MAESLDRKQKNNAINDDIIKDALKTGLSSIKASDYLVNKTLLKCQEEIENGKQEKKNKPVIPWVLKLGTPLVAGALVLILIVNTGNLRMKGSSSPDMAPQIATASGGADNTQGILGFSESKPMEAPAPSAEAAVSAAPSADIKFEISEDEGVEDGVGSGEEGNGDRAEPVEGDLTLGSPNSDKGIDRTRISALYSSDKREPDIMNVSITELEQPFKEIVNLNNQANDTELILREEAILRVSCLIKDGVSAQKLKETDDFNKILSGEGYWALPLINKNGDIEKILTVCSYDTDNPEVAVSDLDVIYTIDRKKYIVSELEVGDNIGADLKMLLSDILVSLGDINESGLVIIDINYGTDFIAIVDMGERKMIVPLLMNDGIFGLENKKIYNWAFFKRTVSESLEE